MRVCLIADKPSAANIVLPHIRELHPDMDPGAFVYAQVHPIFHLNPDFVLPRGLSWRDYPLSGEPRYRPFRFGFDGRDGERQSGLNFGSDAEVVLGPDGSAVSDRDGRPWKRWGRERVSGDPAAVALSRYRSADVVYAAVDTTPSEWLALDRCLAYLALPPGCEVRIPWIDDFGDDKVRAALAAPHLPGGPRYRAMVAGARVRRRFDYGYLANALAVHGRTLRAAGAGPAAPVPSKYGLQTLYDLRRNGPATEGRLVGRMQAWRGTGRYPRTERTRWVGVGGPASRYDILSMLRRAGLVEETDRLLGLSALGRRFLDLLHPDSEDRDLPFRLHAWTDLPEEAGNARVDRYLRTFFGKQVRFLAKRMSAAIG